jgi:repressor of nif and glnA expression
MDRRRRNLLSVLAVLRDCGRAMTGRQITHLLAAAGQDVSERTVRLYLNETDGLGLTESRGRKGREITQAGLEELRASETLRRVGYLSARIDEMTYRMGFDLHTRSGTVVVNTSVVDPAVFAEHLGDICKVFERGFAMGQLACLLRPGERLGDMVVPAGHVGFCTVCSVTINGVLLKHGVPTTSRFGGLLELRDSEPIRFVEMIHYDGTSIDPLEVFIRSGMTDYHSAIRDGNGLVGASFREVPGDARALVTNITDKLATIGMGAVAEIGLPSQPVLDVPVPGGKAGVIVIGGLNPIAILEESGYRAASRALSGLVEFTRLHPYAELGRRLDAIRATM